MSRILCRTCTIVLTALFWACDPSGAIQGTSDAGPADDGGQKLGSEGGSSGSGGTQASTGGTGGSLEKLDGGLDPLPPDSGTPGSSDGGTASDASPDGAKPLTERRIALPCQAPLPTGFCLSSDSGDFIGGGKSLAAMGAGSVQLRSVTRAHVSLNLRDTNSASEWNLDLAAPAKGVLAPGLFTPAERYPFQNAVAGLSISGNGRGCNTLNGKFSIEELQRDPSEGVTRFSVTFEQHCGGGTPALRGVVNFMAKGEPDPTPVPDRVVSFNGKVFRVAYEPGTHTVYGLDAANRRLSKFDLASGSAIYKDVLQVPNDSCVDTKRERLFVVNKGSTLITEYRTSDLSVVRDISWAGTDWGPKETRFKIYCGASQLFVVDGAWAPGLFTIENLDSDSPKVTNRTSQVEGVGGLVLNKANTDLYYWHQYGWGAGSIATSVKRLGINDLSLRDETAADFRSFHRDPVDAPILLHETRGLIFSKNKVFDSTNLAKVIFTLPSTVDTFNGATENAYALDSKHDFLATKNFVYELGRYDIVAETVTQSADQMFFDTNGTLWFLSTVDGVFKSQLVKR